MYKVIKFFTDLQDSNYPYEVGKPFPREGISVSDERLVELAGKNNKQGEPLIIEVKAEQPKPAAKKTTKKTAEK